MVRRLLYFNGLAILCVILFHAAGWGFVAMFSWTPRYLPVSQPVFDQAGSVSYFALRLVEQIVVVAIPAFLFVSGYFIAFSTGRRANIAWKQVFARAKTLFIPYVVWTLFVWITRFVQGERYAIDQYVVMFLTGRTTPAYYYVPLLIQFYLISPLLIPLAKKKWALLLLVTGVIQIALQLSQMAFLIFGAENLPAFITRIALIPKWVFLVRIFWFTLGIVIGFHLSQFKQFLSRYKWVFLTVALISIPLGMIEWEAIVRASGQDWLPHRETVLDSVYAVAIIFAFFAFTHIKLPLSSQVNDLGVKSFGIYLSHIPVMEYTARLIYLFVPWILGIQILFQPIMIVFGLGIPLLMMEFTNRTPLRRYYAYIFG